MNPNMTQINISRLPSVGNLSRYVRSAVQWNLSAVHVGNGNKARRRAGDYVHNGKASPYPYAMNQDEFAAWFNS